MRGGATEGEGECGEAARADAAFFAGLAATGAAPRASIAGFDPMVEAKVLPKVNVDQAI